MKKQLYLIFVFILIFSCSPQKIKKERPVWKGTEETIDGVTIIKNPRKPMYDEGVFLLEEELTIGDKEIESGYDFEVITTIRADDNGNIYVLDAKAQQVKVFDESGKYLRNIGRKGQGPGEFSLPSGLHIISKNEIMVSSITRRLSFFSLSGKFLRQINNSPDPFPVPDSSGNFIVKTWNASDGGKIVTDLKKLNSDLELIFSIGKLEVESPLGQKKLNAFSTLLYFTVLTDDSIVWGINNAFQLSVVDPRGNLVKKIQMDFDPVRVAEEYKKDYLKRNNDDLSRSRGITYKFPEYFPVFKNISTDDQGRIIVGTYISDTENNNLFDVFDSEGRYVAKIAMKNNPVYWKKGKLYSAEEDDEGFLTVKRYKVTWNY